MLYPLIRPLLFAVDAELAHEVSLEMLNQFQALLPQKQFDQPTKVMGLDFPNRVGLAAGLDKNADYLRGLGKLGFGFIEVGTVTPRAQDGNPKPRLFRVVKHRGIINRMGFNNKGVDYLLNHLPPAPRPYLLGINIGKNLSTAVEHAVVDYQHCFNAVYAEADYISINVSSPNTPGLRKLQGEQELDNLLKGISETRKQLEDKHQYSRPIALKISPDLDDKAIPGIAELLHRYSIDGLIATNTTLDRLSISGHRLAAETGGLSGRPLQERSRHILEAFHHELKDSIPIISVGGIDSAEEAKMRIQSGASLVQIYSGLIYAGLRLVEDIASGLTS